MADRFKSRIKIKMAMKLFKDRRVHTFKIDIDINTPTGSDPAPLGYQIFKNGIVVATVAAEGPYIYKTCLTSKASANDYSIMAIYPPGNPSPIIPIRIINE